MQRNDQLLINSNAMQKGTFLITRLWLLLSSRELSNCDQNTDDLQREKKLAQHKLTCMVITQEYGAISLYS